MPRPSSFTDDIAGTICDRLAAGETLRAICRDDEMPDQTTVFRWIRTNGEFRQQYAQAREAQADAWADEIVDIADDGTNDWRKGERGGDVVDTDHISRSRLRVDTRKWIMARAAPKKYGERVTNQVVGKDDDTPIAVADFTDLDRAKALASLIARTKAAAPQE